MGTKKTCVKSFNFIYFFATYRIDVQVRVTTEKSFSFYEVALKIVENENTCVKDRK